MIEYLLTAAAEAGQDAPAEAADPLFYIIQYAVYFAIIVVGLIVLWLLHKKTKLPTHAALRAQMNAAAQSLEQYIKDTQEQAAGKYRLFRRANKLQAKCNKLYYYATMLAEKERDSSMGSMALILDEARDGVAAYRYSALEDEADIRCLYASLGKLREALAALDSIAERDRALLAKKAEK